MQTLLNQREAASALRLSERTLQRFRVDGRGPKYVRAGHSIRYQQNALEEWITSRVRTSTSQEEAA
jgi:predicted DNA-binding transcriptional regulator AlpA